MEVVRYLTRLLAALALFLAFVPAAQANDPLAGGTVRMTPGRVVSVKLVSEGIALEQRSFEISGGSLTAGHALGAITLAGALTFRGESRALTATELVVQLGPRSTLSGLIGGRRMTLAVLDLRGARVTRRALDTRISGAIANLTPASARALNRTFSTSEFARDQNLGTLSIRAKPASVALRAGRTSVAFDPALAAALQSLGVTVDTIAPGEDFSIPIAGGRLDAAGASGSIGHDARAGLSFARAPATLRLRDFVLRLSKRPRLSAELDGDRLTLANLDLTAVKPARKGRRFTLAGIPMVLTTSAAKSLNQAFGTTAFATGMVLGAATVRATAA